MCVFKFVTLHISQGSSFACLARFIVNSTVCIYHKDNLHDALSVAFVDIVLFPGVVVPSRCYFRSQAQIRFVLRLNFVSAVTNKVSLGDFKT